MHKMPNSRYGINTINSIKKLDIAAALEMDMMTDFETEEITYSNYQEPYNEKRWRLSYLKNQFEALELGNLFDRYIQRISHGYFSQFLSLQIILVTTHFIVLLAESVPKEVIPDLILYGTISVFSIVLLTLTDKYVKDHPKLLRVFAGIAFVTIFFTNAFIPFYYKYVKKDGYLRPAYTTYLIISNYIFLNVHNDLVALVLGIFVSIFHLVVLILVTYEDQEKLYEKLGSDTLFLICINGLGIYFRYMNEIVIRRSFLDRRSCIESTHQLKFEEDQENQLMSSIIPQHIIAHVRKSVMAMDFDTDQNKELPKQKPFEDLYVEEHANVSILFADIVNYTAMTTKLNIIELLEVLNELFGRFDESSEELNVLRIKFLGDCYYCVAGLPPNPAPNHAEACVDLGLQMIHIIADIRNRKNLDVNMRIGIHSGKVSSGIIGSIKWQYDIWSKDVDIANKMETEGQPGKVHITEATKQLLRKTYNISESGKTVNNEQTFLIAPHEEVKPAAVPNGIIEEKIATFKEVTEVNEPSENNVNKRRLTYVKRTSTVPINLNSMSKSDAQRSFSLISNYNAQDWEAERNQKRYTYPNERRFSGNPNLERFNRRPSASVNARMSTDRRLTGNERKRRTAFMNNNIKRYKERLVETNKELRKTIESMLLSKFEQWFKVNNMYRFLLVFKDIKSEKNFLTLSDPLFKYYLLSEILLLVLVFVLENLTLSTWHWPSWPFYVCMGVIFIFFLPMTWTYHLWTKYFAKSENHEPNNVVIKVLYHSSKFIARNIWIRLVIYTVLYILFCLCVLSEWMDCFNIDILTRTYAGKIQKQNFLLLMTRSAEEPYVECVVPWHMTETCALAIIMSFLFLRMYMWLKLLYASLIAIVYSLCILEFSGTFYGDSQTYNHSLDPSTSHILSVAFLTLILHLVDRQTEYMHRLDHLWYENLIEKEKQASKVHKVNNMLLKNILPIHVAELYLNVNRHEEVYHEHYDDAAVMFASITNFSIEDMGHAFLKTMSAIISEFDMLLVENSFGRPIEKIKIAKWTYMAACGLVPGLGNTENIRKDQSTRVVESLLLFAASLMRTLKRINQETCQKMKLRIGISYGAIAAGVVGSKKPLYDIWGDPVNMASRMDTTGLPDHIQVLQRTATIIQSFGYVCKYRDNISVKGLPRPVRTYFVQMDEDFNLIKRKQINNT